MFKKFFFAVVPMLMIANSVMASDDMLSMVANLEGADDNTAQVEDADTLGQSDVDALLGEDDNDSDDAIAACFRRMGYGHSYGSYSSYRSYCTPYSYSYNYCAPTYHCYTPVTYSYCAPVTYSCYTPCYTSYWGCW